MHFTDIAKGCLVHLSISHSLISLFHTAFGSRITSKMHQNIPNSYCQYAWSVPHDILFTSLMLYSFLHVKYDSDDAFVGALHASLQLAPATLIIISIGELRTLFYFERFPKSLSCVLFCVRSTSYLTANVLTLYSIN